MEWNWITISAIVVACLLFMRLCAGLMDKIADEKRKRERQAEYDLKKDNVLARLAAEGVLNTFYATDNGIIALNEERSSVFFANFLQETVQQIRISEILSVEVSEDGNSRSFSIDTVTSGGDSITVGGFSSRYGLGVAKSWQDDTETQEEVSESVSVREINLILETSNVDSARVSFDFLDDYVAKGSVEHYVGLKEAKTWAAMVKALLHEKNSLSSEKKKQGKKMKEKEAVAKENTQEALDDRVSGIVSEFKRDPRNKVFVDFDTLLLSATVETGKKALKKKLLATLEKHSNGDELTDDELALYDGALSVCYQIANQCFEPEDEDDASWEFEWCDDSMMVRPA